MTRDRVGGFTIVELVVVLLLLGILGVTAMSRFAGPNAFVPRSIAMAMAAQGHYAAQSAQSGANDITLRISADAGNWRIEVLDGANSLRASNVGMANTRIEVANEANVFDVDAAASLILIYRGHGDLQSAAVGANALNPNAGIEVRTIGDSTHLLCFHPTGYASARTC